MSDQLRLAASVALRAKLAGAVETAKRMADYVAREAAERAWKQHGSRMDQLGRHVFDKQYDATFAWAYKKHLAILLDQQGIDQGDDGTPTSDPAS